MEGVKRTCNKLTREESYELVLWLNNNREALKLHTATLEVSGEMAAADLSFHVTQWNIEDILRKMPRLDWRKSEPVAVEVALRMLARVVVALCEKTAGVDPPVVPIDLVRLADGQVPVIAPKPEAPNGQPVTEPKTINSLFSPTLKG